MYESKIAISGGVSFFDVPLMCAAAPHLGCGTLAKPILSEIEKQVSVQEAWLNRQGTVLPVVWAEGFEDRAATPRARVSAIAFVRAPALALVILASLSGCATIVSGTQQSIAVEAKNPGGGQGTSASCTLRNDKGSWQVDAPGTVEVARSPDDLHVRCQDEGGKLGIAVLVSRASSGFWGNMLLTCGIGMPIDYLSGAGFDYPTPVAIVIGEEARIDKRDSDAASRAANPGAGR